MNKPKGLYANRALSGNCYYRAVGCDIATGAATSQKAR